MTRNLTEEKIDDFSRTDEPQEKKPKSGAYLVGVTEQGESPLEAREHLDELRELVRTLGFEIVGETMTAIRVPNAKFYLGSGKAEEVCNAAKQANAELIVFDTELGPSQQRNLERLARTNAVDRQEIILDIFAERAQTREAVLQVELARYKYFLPRLTRAWSHLSRQRGGAKGTRGEGEKQIENDRRMVKYRIGQLEEELATVRRQRDVQRKGRIRRAMPLAAIVGYTNAGKSSLLNTLTGADALDENKLFATLDPTTRKLVLPNKSELLLTDTVGFVRKLPHSLVEAFKSTLEEAVLADFLVMVLDISSPDVESHWQTTLSVLTELGAQDKPMLTVFNKCDRQKDALIRTRLRSLDPNGVFISCRTGEGLDELRQTLVAYMKKRTLIDDLLIPPEHPEIVAAVYSKASLLEGKYQDDGSFRCTVRIPGAHSELFAPYSCSKVENKVED